MFLSEENYVVDLLFDDKTVDALYVDVMENNDMKDSTSERI